MAVSQVGPGVVGLSGLPLDRIASMVTASCEAQGVPVKVSHPTVVRLVAVLLGADGRAVPARKRSGTGAGRAAGSAAPDHAHPRGVEGASRAGVRSDLDVIDQCLDDAVLTVQVQVTPGAA